MSDELFDDLPAEEEKPTPLFRAMTEAFNKVKKVAEWGNREKEFKRLKVICEKIESLPGNSQEQGPALLRTFYEKKRAGRTDKFWSDAPFTPSGLTAKWDTLIAELDNRSIALTEDTGVDVEDIEDPDADDILGSMQQIFQRDFPPALRRRLLRMIGNKPQGYLVAMHDDILKGFSATSTRPMPDAAAFNDTIKRMGPAETYVEPDRKALPAPPEKPAPQNCWQRVQWLDLMSRLGSDLGEKKEGREINMEERELARIRVMKGNASDHEKEWIERIDSGRLYPKIPGVTNAGELVAAAAGTITKET